MKKIINRTGEEKINSFGSRMIIKEYRKFKEEWSSGNIIKRGGGVNE